MRADMTAERREEVAKKIATYKGRRTAQSTIIRSAKKRAVFLAHLAHSGLITRACQAAGIDETLPYQWAKDHPDFAEAMAEARKHGDSVALARMEAEADRRAVDGISRSIYHKGTVVGHEKTFDSLLLMFRMKFLNNNYREHPPLDTITAGNITIQVASFQTPQPAPAPQAEIG
jgi:hypothetical protein